MFRSRAWIAAGVLALVASGLVSGSVGELLPSVRIHNDTNATVTIWIVHNGDELEPVGDDPRLGPGETGEFGLAGFDSTTEDRRRLCTDGDIIARSDDGAEIRVSPPVCGGVVSLAAADTR